MALILVLISLFAWFGFSFGGGVEQSRGQAEPLGGAVVRVAPGRTIAVRDRPDGSVLTRLGPRTEYGSPQAVGVVRQEGNWLAVTTPDVPDNQLGWVETADAGVQISFTPLEVEVDLSRRELTVREGGRAIRQMSVAVGRAGSTTPSGHFAVTDKLRGPDFGPYYGCCILALSGRQPNLPENWDGDDRLAIHGTQNPAAIGGAYSAGCVYAKTADLQFLMRRLPLGTPVVIHP